MVLVMFSYPLQVHPCRASVAAVLRWRPARRNTSDAGWIPGNPGAPSTPGAAVGGPTEISETRFAAITTAIIVFSYIMAMTVESLEKVLAYVGSTGSTSISFILPGLFYYKISAPDSPQHQRLLKEDDDEESDDDDDANDSADMENVRNTSWTTFYRSQAWQRLIIRKMSLALACYGLAVMIICLVTNTYFEAAH